MEKGESTFPPRDRIGQFTMRNLDITDIWENLYVYEGWVDDAVEQAKTPKLRDGGARKGLVGGE